MARPKLQWFNKSFEPEVKSPHILVRTAMDKACEFMTKLDLVPEQVTTHIIPSRFPPGVRFASVLLVWCEEVPEPAPRDRP